jgi:hypothetical protein
LQYVTRLSEAEREHYVPFIEYAWVFTAALGTFKWIDLVHFAKHLNFCWFVKLRRLQWQLEVNIYFILSYLFI